MTEPKIISERWRDIEGYEGFYQVSDRGRVKRMRAYKSTRANRILVQGVVTHGYMGVSLSKRNKQTSVKVHSLVAHAFLGSCPRGHEINHIDGKKYNNCVDNLEYVTKSQNFKHSVKIGLRPPYLCGENAHNAKLTYEIVEQIRREYPFIKSQSKLAKKCGVTQTTIGLIVRRKTWNKHPLTKSYQ